MDRPRILLTRRIPEEGTARLFAEAEVDLWHDGSPMPRSALLDRVQGVDALLCLISDRVDAEVMDRAPTLKAIGNYAVGYDNIDVKAATERGIPVFNTPGVLTDATADMAFALLMALSRRIVEGDRLVREGRFKAWDPTMLLGKDLAGSTMGVVGAGKIGSAILHRAKAFDMDLVYHSRHRDQSLERELGARYLSLDDLLRCSDVVSLNVPLTNETRHLIGARELSLMKGDALLINTSRGPVVDEKELVKALSDRRIGGAGLDVYEREPLLEPGLAELENVVLAPHLGSATVRTRARMAKMVSDDILDHLSGKAPKNCVNPSVLGHILGGSG
jgi:glyoxylate reductase